MALRAPDRPLKHGTTFVGEQWYEGAGHGPVIMCDHYLMTGPTFPMHPHQGISAVALVFDRAKGSMVSSDSVGTNHIFGPGDLHWTMAGSGVTHTQTPTPGSEILALQLFIDSPKKLKTAPAKTFHVKSEDIPVYRTKFARIRIVAGKAWGLASPFEAPQPIVILEGWTKKSLRVPIPLSWKIWLLNLDTHEAGYVSHSTVTGHFVLIAGPAFKN